MKTLALLFVSLFLVTQPASVKAEGAQDNCSPIDLRESTCLPKAKNQSDTDFCYAYSAAELASYHFCKEVSPLALGLLNSEKKREKGAFWAGGGYPDKALELGNKNGFCLESEVPSQLIENSEAMALRRFYLTLLQTENQELNDGCSKTRLRLQEILPLADVSAIIKFISDGQKPEELFKLVRSSCKNPIQEKVEVEKCPEDLQKRIGFINEKLNQGPISIARETNPNRSPIGKIPDGHAMTVIGRKWDESTNQCQYMIRDSGGRFKWGGIRVGGSELHRLVSESDLSQYLASEDAMCFAVKGSLASRSGQ